MPRGSRLTFDRGTLVLHPPPKGKSWSASLSELRVIFLKLYSRLYINVN